jgi:hypothetical protein
MQIYLAAQHIGYVLINEAETGFDTDTENTISIYNHYVENGYTVAIKLYDNMIVFSYYGIGNNLVDFMKLEFSRGDTVSPIRFIETLATRIYGE